jgi:SAM-dependent methyltransferase
MAYRAVWERKPVLREVYSDMYRLMLSATVSGPTLEIGGGSGNFKAFAPSAISTDIQFAPWLDVVADAQRLPFAAESFSNIVLFDVLHHIERPLKTMQEAQRLLLPGGRLIFCEPAITPISGIFYRLLHAEPVDMSADPLTDAPISKKRDPWESNQAIPTLLVGRFRDSLSRLVPELELINLDWFAFVAYPLSGGFRPWSLLPASAARPTMAIEWRLRKVLGRLAAFRLLAVYRKHSLASEDHLPMTEKSR